MSKKCTKCGETKSLKDFHFRNEKPISICKNCIKIKNATYRKENKSKIEKINRIYRKNNKEKKREQNSRWNTTNKNKITEIQAIYYLKNKEKIKTYSSKWKKENKGKATAQMRKYQLSKLNQISPDANFNKIQEFYKEAQRKTKETGSQHHVDHIMPLSKGGLHHQENLQVITATENLRKGNKLLAKVS